MWSFVGFLISRGQLVLFNIWLAESLVFTGLEGEIARNRSQMLTAPRKYPIFKGEKVPHKQGF